MFAGDIRAAMTELGNAKKEVPLGE